MSSKKCFIYYAYYHFFSKKFLIYITLQPPLPNINTEKKRYLNLEKI